MSIKFSRYLLLFSIAGLLLSVCNAGQGGVEQSQTEKTKQVKPLESSDIPSIIPSQTVTSNPTQTLTPVPTPNPYTTPDWFNDAVVYEVFMRSFRDSDGDFQIIEPESSGIGPWGFLRNSGEQTILALFNFGTEEQEVTLSDIRFSTGELLDLITGKSYPSPSQGENFHIELAPAEAVWLTFLK